MKLKGFDQYINENFKPIDVELYEAEVIKESDIDWMEIIFKEFPTPAEKTNILKSINSLKWEPVGGSKPMGPGLAIQSTIKEFKIPKVDLIAYGGTPFGSDNEPDASYSAFGIQGHYSNGTYRIFFVDKGTEVVTVGSIRIDVEVNQIAESLVELSDDLKSNFRSWESDHDNYEDAEGLFNILTDRHSDVPVDKVRELAYHWVGYEESVDDIDESVTKTLARKHPMYNRMLKFLAKFPDDARSWAEATDEIRDMARTAREYHTELDKDMLFDEWETNPNAPQPLDFRKLKTPSEWNTEGKKYIIDTLDKMGKQAVDEFMNDFKHWFMLNNLT